VEHSQGPEIVAGIFKVLAVLSVVAGVVVGLEAEHGLNASVSTGTRLAATIGIVGGVVGAAALAFFGYVLDLLMDIRASNEVVSELALVEDGDA
jgi:uncharacterized membrane protein YeaQ/YmgE (transglycosylase-associated protein family)